MSSIPSYSKIYNLGHDAINNLFESQVEISEKLDGSQFSFGITPTRDIVMRSKGKEVFFEAHDDLFDGAVKQVERIRDCLYNAYDSDPMGIGIFGAYFYGEYLRKQKHNVICYEKTPKNNIALFGVRIGENFLKNYESLEMWAKVFDFDVVPLIFSGTFENDLVIKSSVASGHKKFRETAHEKLKAIIYGTPSYLGGSLIEGVVIKNYNLKILEVPFSPCFGKFVRHEFKEKLHKDWGKISGRTDIDDFINAFKTEARWLKAVQHLRDSGTLENSPRDIGKLILEIQKDLDAEETGFIKEKLYSIFIRRIKACATAGVAEWYKEALLRKQFEI